MRHLLSKIVAGGLSAGVILLWWPLVFPSDTVESWLVRGVLWTLCFELMLHAFAPLEESLWRSRGARRLAAQAQVATARLGTASPRKRHHGRMVVAAVALTVPLALLATAPAHRLAPKPVAAAPVRHVTEVKRVVRVERRTVMAPGASRPDAGARPDPTPHAAGTSTGLASGRQRRGARRPTARAAVPRRSSRGSGRSGGRGSGSSSPNADANASSPGGPTAGTPSPGAAVGSGERGTTPNAAQPKRRVVA